MSSEEVQGATLPARNGTNIARRMARTKKIKNIF